MGSTAALGLLAPALRFPRPCSTGHSRPSLCLLGTECSLARPWCTSVGRVGTTLVTKGGGPQRWGGASEPQDRTAAGSSCTSPLSAPPPRRDPLSVDPSQQAPWPRT